MNMKKLLCMALAALMAFVSFPIVARAAERTISAGGTYDIGDYYSAGDTLAIHTTGAVTLTNTGGITATNFQILCDAGVNLTIAGVVIDNSGNDGKCPLAFTGGGNTLTLTAGAASTLTGGYKQPGVRAETGTALTIGGDGTLNATGGLLGAGIGSSNGNPSGNITIINGTINAIGKGDAGTASGAGIGSGAAASCGDITILGGTVNATSQNGGAGIGGGYVGSGGIVTILGGSVVANAQVIGAFSGNDIGSGGTNNNGGTLNVDGAASLTLSSMGTNAAVTLGDAKISDASGHIANGYYVNGALFIGTVVDISNGPLFIATGSYNLLLTGKSTVSAVDIAAGVTFDSPIVFFNLDIERSSGCVFYNGTIASVELCGKNTLTSGPGCAGLQCGSGADLTIGSTGAVPGSLTATGGDGGAGIGGADGAETGTVSIESGIIYASGGTGAQDIGRGNNGSGGSLAISGDAGVFLRNNNALAPTTATHHNVTAAGFPGGSFYGVPVPWTGNFGAYLSLYAVTCDYQISGTPNGVKYANIDGSFTVPDDAALAADGVANPGHHLVDWVSGGTHYTPGATATISGDKTLTATWEANAYTVKYNANNGSGSMADTSFSYGVPQALPANAFWRSGYDFAGWALSPGGAVKYADRQSVSDLTAASNGTVTLYACWSAQYYTISYTLDGGVATPANPAGYTVESGAITLTNPEKKGSAFDGWSGTGITGTAMSVTIPAGSMGSREYTAHWLLNGCTVKFDAGRGSAVADQSVLYGGKVKKTADPRREGCIFQGWYSDKAFTKPWNFDGDTVTASITLYAKWKPTGVYAIAAKASPAKGGRVTGAGRYAGGESVTLTAVPADGYRFVNWTEGKKTASGNAAYVFVSSKARSLTAKFAKIGRPAITKAAPAGHGNINLKWSAVKGVDGYYIYRASSRYGTYSRVTSVTAELFTDVGLTAGKKYYYKVQAYCVAAGKITVGGFSTVKSAKLMP